jgi:hypothetical protein
MHKAITSVGILVTVFLSTKLSVAQSVIADLSPMDPKTTASFKRIHPTVVTYCFGGCLNKNGLDFDWRYSITSEQATSGHSLLRVDVRGTRNSLDFRNGDNGVLTGSVNLFFAVIGSGVPKGAYFEEKTELSASVDDLTKRPDVPIVFTKRFQLNPGKYKISLVFRDIRTGEFRRWVVLYRHH